MDPRTVDPVETAYAEARDALEDLRLARSLGEPLDRSETIATVEARYAAARIRVSVALAALPSSLADDDWIVVAVIRRALHALDEVEPPPPDVVSVSATSSQDGAATALLRRTTMERYGQAAAALPWRGQTLDRLTIFGRLAASTDADEQRSLFMALEPCWRAVDGDGGSESPYRRLLRADTARWAAEGSPIQSNAAALGIDPSEVEELLRAVLCAWRDAVHPNGTLIEPWAHRALGPPPKPGSRSLSVADIRSISDAYFSSLGADPSGLGVTYDIEPRHGRPPVSVAFTTARRLPRRETGGRWSPAEPWVVAEYRYGGPGQLAELLHETGHALHYAAIRTRSALAGDQDPNLEGWWEAWADVVGWDADEPAFQERFLGQSQDLGASRRARYAPGVALEAAWSLFEIEIHRHPDRRPNDVWAEIAERELCLVGHPEWSWWAVRGQLVESPGYLANYVLGAVVTAALRAHLAELRGPWWERPDPGWYAFVSESLLRWGVERSPAQVLRDFLGGPLTAEPLLADVALAAG